MKAFLGLILLAPALAQCAPAPRTVPEAPRYVYYLHGKIIEDLGPRGVSPRFGASDYPGIVRALERAGLRVVSEVRPKDTDVSAYAEHLVKDIRVKLASGVPVSHITVIGASKGAVIAMLVSSRLRQNGVRYVFLASCNDWMERTFAPRFTGEVLSIYDSADDIGQSCGAIAARSPELNRFEEIRLDTGLGHGLVYRPLPSWIEPATRWAKHGPRR